MDLNPRHETLPYPAPSSWRQYSRKLVSPESGGLLWNDFPDGPCWVGSPSFPPRRREISSLALLLGTMLVPASRPVQVWAQAPPQVQVSDVLRKLQTRYAASAGEKEPRVFHFGSQGAGSVFSNHASHTNRLVPVYVFGRKADLGSVTGENSRYRDAEKIRAAYGVVPENTVNPGPSTPTRATSTGCRRTRSPEGPSTCSSSGSTASTGPPPRPRPSSSSGKVYTEGKGSGLFFQDYTADGSAQYGFVVTSPTHDKSIRDVDRQLVTIPPDSLGGGYDARIAGPNPWTLGPLGRQAPGYLKGQSADEVDGRASSPPAGSCTPIPTRRRAPRSWSAA